MVAFRDFVTHQYVCATGFYCCVIRAELFKSGVFRHDLLGPDFYFGLDVAARGFTNVIDWSVRCGHATETIYLTPDMSDAVVRSYHKVVQESRQLYILAVAVELIG
jgi:hypothetical protein